jgi:hypothetical protein
MEDHYSFQNRLRAKEVFRAGGALPLALTCIGRALWHARLCPLENSDIALAELWLWRFEHSVLWLPSLLGNARNACSLLCLLASSCIARCGSSLLSHRLLTDSGHNDLATPWTAWLFAHGKHEAAPTASAFFFQASRAVSYAAALAAACSRVRRHHPPRDAYSILLPSLARHRGQCPIRCMSGSGFHSQCPDQQHLPRCIQGRLFRSSLRHP